MSLGGKASGMASLIRALSWPLITTTPLDVSSSEKSCNRTNNPSNGKNGKHAPTFQQLIAARRLICRRYYPEGSFGYVVLFVAFIVNILTHGLQLSAYFFLMPSGKRFKVEEVKCLGKCLLILKLIMTLECWEVPINVSSLTYRIKESTWALFTQRRVSVWWLQIEKNWALCK